MTASIIDCKSIVTGREFRLKDRIANLLKNAKRAPCLAVIQVGNDEASSSYIKHKKTVAKRLGIHLEHFTRPITISEFELIRLIHSLNDNSGVDGILVQFPLPGHISQQTIIESINPDKDVDGQHPYNMGRLATRSPTLRPCTPRGVIHILDAIDEQYKGRTAVVIGASNIVGRPMALELLLVGATVTVAHKFTPPDTLIEMTQSADIVISAVGKPGFLQPKHVKPGTTIIDVGINQVGDKIVGDVHPDVFNMHCYITPVPGGVGPVTVMVLMENVVQAYQSLGNYGLSFS